MYESLCILHQLPFPFIYFILCTWIWNTNFFPSIRFTFFFLLRFLLVVPFFAFLFHFSFSSSSWFRNSLCFLFSLPFFFLEYRYVQCFILTMPLSMCILISKTRIYDEWGKTKNRKTFICVYECFSLMFIMLFCCFRARFESDEACFVLHIMKKKTNKQTEKGFSNMKNDDYNLWKTEYIFSQFCFWFTGFCVDCWFCKADRCENERIATKKKWYRKIIWFTFSLFLSGDYFIGRNEIND